MRRLFAHSGRRNGMSCSSSKGCEGFGGKGTFPENAVLRPATSGSRPGCGRRGFGVITGIWTECSVFCGIGHGEERDRPTMKSRTNSRSNVGDSDYIAVFIWAGCSGRRSDGEASWTKRFTKLYLCYK